MATASKPKCKYWEKCYRKDAGHKAGFLHPSDDKDDETVKKSKDKKENSKPVPLSRQKTHELSQNEDDDDVEMIDAYTPPPLKKLRSDDKQEDAKPKIKKEASITADEALEKQMCKYWEKCFRKDPTHLKTYLHPGDISEDERKRRLSSRPKPKRKLEDGDEVTAGGFKLKRIGSDYQCSCIGWKTQSKPTNKRTCKHLREHLGDTFEQARVGSLPVDKRKPEPTQFFKHLNVSVLLAHKYDEKNVNPTGWWMSEKLDGVRAFWNGKCFYSRLGNPFYAPRWFTKDLPTDMHLDGELFGGRKKFQSTISIVKTPECENWKKIKYCVFDAPNLEKQPFEDRLSAIKDYFDAHKPQYAEMVEHYKCTGKDHIEKDLKKIIGLGGEGLMIRQPKSKYERTRSKTLLKIKKFYDAEAVVVGYEPGKGRFQGAVGALKVKMACGKVFAVGSGMSDKDHRKPPKIGSIITYKFQEYTNSGSPRFPTFVGIRIDMDKPKDAELPPIPKDV